MTHKLRILNSSTVYGYTDNSNMIGFGTVRGNPRYGTKSNLDYATCQIRFNTIYVANVLLRYAYAQMRSRDSSHVTQLDSFLETEI